ncbi:sensor domain-containing diguanylate cyclase [Heliorestis acidaminivorans]|uniref:sensor domain-containing diguanylate cyclase n=1 Tax=Heliorestis acidaminivorans TaxID=553427 RepID=UPI0014793367|nr:sensor domain-containing diguanylate cyclase [Heliorestis acidaminivorans]
MCKKEKSSLSSGLLSPDDCSLYKELLTNARDIIYKLDLQGNFLEVSPATEELTGYRLAELIGMNIKELIAHDKADQIEEILTSKIFSQEPIRFELDLITNKSEILAVEINSTLVCRTDKPCYILGIARDISKHKLMARQLAEQRALLNSLVNSMPDIVFYKDTEGHYLGCNRDFEILVGKRESEIVGLTDAELFPPEVVSLYTKQEKILLETKKPQRVEVYLVDSNNRPCFYDTMKTLFTGPKGEEFGLIGVNRDITELVNAKLEAEIARDEAEHLASTDFLTGVMTRRALIQRLEGEINRARREGTVLSMIFADIDHFKKVNDSYGHQAGDKVLQIVAQLFKSRCRSYDLIGRSGGEEFMICLPGASKQRAFKIAEEMRIALHATSIELFNNTKQKVSARVTASFGVSSMSEHDIKEIDDLIREGDSSLYKAKELGRNRVCSIE